MRMDVEAGTVSKQQTEGSNRGSTHTQSDCLLKFCRLINVGAGCGALLCMVALGMAMSVSEAEATTKAVDWASHTETQALRLFSMFLCIVVLLVETEWEVVAAWLRAMEHWVGRGLAQGFLGVLTLALSRSTGTSDFDRSLGIYRQVSGLTMIGFAFFYFFGGLLCLGWLKKARHRQVQERIRLEQDMEVLDKQREELRSMLASYSKD